MLTKSILAVAAFAVATPVFAGQGADQYARILGVEPGAYTVAQLVDLDRAYKENDAQAVKFILSQGNADLASRAAVEIVPSTNGGKNQIARELGVNADDYTLSELAVMQSRLDN